MVLSRRKAASETFAFAGPAVLSSPLQLRLQRPRSKQHTVARRPRWTCKRDGALPGNPNAKTYSVTVHDREPGVVHTLQVPEDRYIWHAMEEAGIELPASCRNGCCTTCAVRVKSGKIVQDEALGLVRQMRETGYGLLCVAYARSDVVCELQDEDEVYLRQFGETFEAGGIEWGGVMADLDED